MAVTPISPTVPSAESRQAEASAPGELGQEDFLTMLVAQLQNQDPLNPMEGTDFTAQLAQFNSLEQLMAVNDNLKALQTSQNSIYQSQAVTYIDKTVSAHDNAVAVRDGEAEDIHFELARDAVTVRVSVYDGLGGYVATIDAENMAAGEQSVSWDGENDSGVPVSDGLYRFEVAAIDAESNPVAAQPLVMATVTGVTYQDGAPVLIAGDRQIPLASVSRVHKTRE